MNDSSTSVSSQKSYPSSENKRLSYQPEPTRNQYPAIWPLVIEDAHDRDKFGQEKHGVPLQPFNGRIGIYDVYQELLDGTVYTRTLIYQLEALGLIDVLREKFTPNEADEFRKEIDSLLQKIRIKRNAKD